VTDPANPGQPYGGQPGQPYGGQPGQPYGGQPGQPDPYGNQPGPPNPGPPNPYSSQPGEAYSGQQAFGAPTSPPPSPESPYGGYSGEAPAPYPGGPVPPPAKKGGAGRIIGIIVGVVVVLLLAVCGGAAWFTFNKAKSDPANATVGDCLAGDTMDSTEAKEVNNIKKVECTSADAKYKVIGIVANKTEAQFNIDQDICKAYPSAASALWQGTKGQSGSVLCLEPIKK
jgi:hypothetical protein